MRNHFNEPFNMITQLKKITGVGKFLNFQNDNSQRKAKDFGKTNLIYGDNGKGKTTLALLFKSLKEDDNLLLRKRSFDTSIPQEVILDADHPDAPFHFLNGKWNQYLPDIEIFDIHFINENIYTGLEIQNSHKKNLFEIILGMQGIELKHDIAVLKDRIKNGNKIVRETTKVIEQEIGAAFSAIEYCDIQSDSEIEEKLKWKNQEIETAKNSETIQQKSSLQKLPLLQLPYDLAQATSILQQSIDNISDDFLQQFNDHKNHLDMGGKSEEWIQQGYEAMQDNACPFCAQPLDESVQLITAYQQYFNETYKTLLVQISQLTQAVKQFNPEVFLLDVDSKISSNLLLIDFWKKYITAPIELKSILSEKETLLDAFQKIKETVEKKSNNPIHAQPIENLQLLDNQVVSINNHLTKLNDTIAIFNEGIETIKASEAPAMAQLEKELAQLLAIQKRENPNIVTSCDNLKTYTNGIARLKESMKNKQQELDIFKQTVFVSFEKKINDLLKIFAPYIQLKKLNSGYIGSSTDPAVKFGLYVNGKALNQKKGAVEATIKYSLSEGDKAALALSFFMAKLELDEHLNDKIIIIDDAISSFDHGRKTAFLQELLKISQRANQVFLLTHDKILADDFIEKNKAEGIEVNGYELEEDGGSGVVVDMVF